MCLSAHSFLHQLGYTVESPLVFHVDYSTSQLKNAQFFFKYFVFNYVSMGVGELCEPECSACGGQKGALDPWEQELQAFVRTCCGSGLQLSCLEEQRGRSS